MEGSQLNNLYILSFLDSLNLGLIMPILNPHLMSIGGTHTTTGLLLSLHCIAQIISTTLIKALSRKYNKKIALFYTLIVAFISNVIAATSINFWVVFVARLAFYLTNQTQTVLNSYVHATEHNNKHDIIKGVFGALGVAGFLIGPILSGYMFEWNYGFTLVCLLASGVSIISILIVLSLPNLPNETESIPNVQSYIYDDLMVSSQLTIDKLELANVKCNWPIYLMTALVRTSFTAFFIKFSMLLKIHYNASSVMIGYTVAYQSVVMFLMNFAVLQVKSLFSSDTKIQLVQILSTTLIIMSAICYAMTHNVYMLLYIPLALSRLIVDTMWPQCVLTGRGQEVTDGATVFTTLTAIVVPFLLGNFCDIFDDHAVKMFSIAPLLFAMVLTVHSFEPVPVQLQSRESNESQNTDAKSDASKDD